MFAQIREENKSRNLGVQEVTYQLATGRKRNYSLNMDYSVHENIRFKTRIQFSDYTITAETTHGLAIVQDIHVSLGKFHFIGRHALFDTQDFDNRQYVYENDVWLAYSLPAYYGVGVKNFILMEYNFSKKLSCWIKYSRIRYTDRETIGSGLETINGNIKNDIKAQVVWRF